MKALSTEELKKYVKHAIDIETYSWSVSIVSDSSGRLAMTGPTLRPLWGV